MSRIGFGMTVVALVVAAVPIAAHHSAVMFESERTVTLEGTVKEFQFTNPHSWLLVDVKGKDGSVVTWGFEAEGPTVLIQKNIRPADFKAGTKVTMTGRPMKDGRPAAIWTKAVRADGKVFMPFGDASQSGQ